jgi:peptidoglycan LD-endopeptidase LytH
VRGGREVLIIVSVTVGSACGRGLTPLPPGTAPTPIGPAVTATSTRPASPGPLEGGVTEADLDALWARQLMVPVAGMPPTALRNDYDARRGNRTHRALDMLAPKGTPVLAADDGRIGRVGTTPTGGNIVYATDPDERFVYYYAHLERHARGVSAGARVRKGDVLGYVGTTGNAPSTVPHLHFQVMKRGAGRVWWDGTPINPWPFFVLPGVSAR